MRGCLFASMPQFCRRPASGVAVIASLAVLLAAIGGPGGQHQTARAAGVQVRYAVGWNLVGGPTGTVFNALGSIYSLDSGDTSYDASAGDAPIAGGRGYRAYFPAATSVTLNGAGSGSFSVPAPAGRYLQIGNPSGVQAVTVSGADQVLAWDAAAGSYTIVTQLAVGQGAWALSVNGGTIELTATGAPFSLPTDTPTPAPSPSAAVSPLSIAMSLDCSLSAVLVPNFSAVQLTLSASVGGQPASGVKFSGSLTIEGGSPMPLAGTIDGTALFNFVLVNKAGAGAHARAHVDATLGSQQASADASCTFP